uniref:Uncharacterized protein n=1 Tax=Ananas comosus var. bracteatus TaxID=296719 RepID=A0A6V7QGI8_ANACO|nr:unnamed protein product [Ananas comosus var. bracteatus]
MKYFCLRLLLQSVSWNAPLRTACSSQTLELKRMKLPSTFQESSKRFVHQVPATEFVAFTRSFHGTTMGALALTSEERFHEPFELVMPGVTFVQYGSIEEAKRTIRKGKTAAVFVEPVQGEGGIYTATKDFLQALRTFCDDAGALLVFDEV